MFHDSGTGICCSLWPPDISALPRGLHDSREKHIHSPSRSPAKFSYLHRSLGLSIRPTTPDSHSEASDTKKLGQAELIREWLGEPMPVSEIAEVEVMADFGHHCWSAVPAAALGSTTLSLPQWLCSGIWGTAPSCLVFRLICPVLQENL